MAQMGDNEKHKKKHVIERPFLGKLSKNSCRIGIVGLPNVGKSSLFNTFSQKQVPAENYPFCTIDPNRAIVPVPDKRFTHLCKHYKPRSEVQAVLEVWDIAGLVKGASEGKGLGNEFLSNIQAVDAIYHVVRAFKDSNVEHVEGSVDPVRDMEIIASELRQKDLALMKKKLDHMGKGAKRSNDKKIKEECDVVEKIVNTLEAGQDVQAVDWTNREIEHLQEYNLFSAKPVVFLVNVSDKDWLQGRNKHMEDIKKWCNEKYPGSPVIPFSAAFEKKILEMDAETSEKYLQENNTKSQLNKIINAGYHALHLIHFFTAGEDEVKCWTIRQGTKAPQAAGTIHSDMENGFICAETFAYDDFKLYGSEQEVKTQGKYHQNGKNYEVQDGDILFFKFNPQGGKKK